MTDETSSIKRVTQDDCYLITSDVTLSPSVILQDIVMALGGAVFPVLKSILRVCLQCVVLLLQRSPLFVSETWGKLRPFLRTRNRPTLG